VDTSVDTTVDTGDGDGDGDGTVDTEMSSEVSTGDGDGDAGFACVSDEDCDFPKDLCTSEGTCEPSAQILYMNFNGGGFSYDVSSESNAHTNVHNISTLFDGDFVGYGGVESQEWAIFAMVVADLAEFRVAVTDLEPPNTLEYAELAFVDIDVMQGVLGMTALNCGDLNPLPIGFITLTAAQGYAEQQVANSVGIIVGQMFGLERVTDDDDLMNEFPSQFNTAYTDVCSPGIDAFQCEHTAGACVEGSQNSYRELEMRFGLR